MFQNLNALILIKISIFAGIFDISRFTQQKYFQIKIQTCRKNTYTDLKSTIKISDTLFLPIYYITRAQVSFGFRRNEQIPKDGFVSLKLSHRFFRIKLLSYSYAFVPPLVPLCNSRSASHIPVETLFSVHYNPFTKGDFKRLSSND